MVQKMAKNPTDKLIRKIEKLEGKLEPLESGKKTVRTHGILAPFTFDSFLDELKNKGEYREELAEEIEEIRDNSIGKYLSDLSHFNKEVTETENMSIFSAWVITGIFFSIMSVVLSAEVVSKLLRDTTRPFWPGNWFLSMPGGAARRQKKLANKLRKLNIELRSETLKELQIR